MTRAPLLIQLDRLVRRTRGGRDTDLLEARLALPLTLDAILSAVAPLSQRSDFADLLDRVPTWKRSTREALRLETGEDEAGDFLFGTGMALADALLVPFEQNNPFAVELDLVTGLELLPELYQKRGVRTDT